MKFTYIHPKANSVRYLRRFAWFPVFFEWETKSEIVWLEFYWRKQRCDGSCVWRTVGTYPKGYYKYDEPIKE